MSCLFNNLSLKELNENANDKVVILRKITDIKLKTLII